MTRNAKRAVIVGWLIVGPLLIADVVCSKRPESKPTEAPPPPIVARPPAPAAPSPLAPTVRGGVDAQSQRDRAKIIEGLTKMRVFHRVDLDGGTPMLWVGPAFDGLPYEDKARFTGLVLQYAFVNNPKHVEMGLVDWRTGKVIGRVDGLYGLSLK